jgi:chromosome segregation ATPase
MAPLPSGINSPIHPDPSSVHTKFEHFFAGHSDAVVPQPPKKPPSDEDLAALEGKLNAVTLELAQANKQQAGLARDLSLLKLEKEQLQTTLEMELQTAEEQARSLESELAQYKGEVEELWRQQEALESTRAELEERKGQVESLQQQLEAADQRNGEAAEANEQVLLKEQELAKLKAEMDVALRAKDLELIKVNSRFELEKAKWAE